MKEEIKGKGAVGIAIAYFSLRGMVSIPLAPCDYNLVFDDQGKLNKINVISCSYKSPYGIYCVAIRSMTATATKKTLKEFDKNSCDILFVVTDSLDMYAIPSECIESKRQLSLCKYSQYKVNF